MAICPITQEEIVHPALTINGYIYESSAIKNWLNNNVTEPCTNQILPVSYLFEPKCLTESIEDLARRYAKNAHHWCRFMKTVHWYKQQNPIEMKNKRGTTTNDDAIEYIKANGDYCFNTNHKSEEKYKIPDGVLMSGLSIQQDEYSAFKSMNLVAADLTGCTFTDCVFDNCNFSFADISDCSFIRCSFEGTTCFHGTDMNRRTKFIDCICEETWEWTTLEDKKNVYRLLRQRGLHNLKIDKLTHTE